MQIRPLQVADLTLLGEIDGVIESSQYLHVERAGEGFGLSWSLDERPLRERLVRANPIDDERQFLLKQVAAGIEEGLALVVEHDDLPVALLLATPDASSAVFRLHELRVDYDHRREGIATAMLFQLIGAARDQGLRAVSAETTTDNLPAARLLSKCGFDIAGLDALRKSNHDLVKESVTLFWYAAME